ncbi:hypothetical protein ActroDRAFT_0108 [Actinospica robiniae DSM 44927]|uniref:Uncharacterized protein n=1 Tax=Actinospica robiniae DSM 44927 TaxID=479430 RepID=W9E504_9ACTN|nr:hypothetical protein ActroDRAFT_0108 [Actinospica robiniae DSM 44927]
MGGAIALVGIALEFVGLGRTPLAAQDRVWHDIGLGFVVLGLAVPLRVWRRFERTRYSEALGAEAWKRIIWRAGVSPLLLGILGLLAGRALESEGAGAASHVVWVGALVCVALCPTVLLTGRVALRCAPRALRRSEITSEIVRELSAGNAFGVIPFNPDLGAAGRPDPLHERLPGPAVPSPRSVKIRKILGEECTLEWTGERLCVRRAHPVTGVARDLPREVAEMVCSASLDAGAPYFARDIGPRPVNRLRLLDAQGYVVVDFGVVLNDWEQFAALARRAGLLFRAYELRCEEKHDRKVDRLLFPRRGDVLEFL